MVCVMHVDMFHKKTVLTLTLLINFKCDAGGLHMSLTIIESCSVAISVVTQRRTQKNIEGSSVHLRCGTNLNMW